MAPSEELYVLATILRMHIFDSIYVLYKVIFPPGCRKREKHTNLVGSSPQLSIQSYRLVVDFRLIVPPAALHDGEFTSRLCEIISVKPGTVSQRQVKISNSLGMMMETFSH